MEVESYLQKQLSAWQNPLLLKDGVGRAKPTIYDIPRDLTFGLAQVTGAEGAGEIINVWKPHEASVAEKDFSVNYLKWNRWEHDLPRTRSLAP